MGDEVERARLIGCRDGLSHAMIAVGSLRDAITGPAGAYLPPHLPQPVDRPIKPLELISRNQG